MILGGRMMAILDPKKFLSSKKLWGLRNFGSKKIFWSKNFWANRNSQVKKLLGPNKFLVQKMLGPKNMLETIFGPKKCKVQTKFWIWQFQVRKKFRSNKVWSPRNSWLNFFLGPNKIWAGKKIWKKCWVQKNFGS